MMKLIILGISVVLINTVITSLIIRNFALQVSKSLTLSETETKLEIINALNSSNNPLLIHVSKRMFASLNKPD
ncbi:hypothetical protein HAU47_10315 [Weissella confusa]|uniref:hypothetical protein n=1 Tax=Weissella confusa TaxID=1583 RepID=UPI0018F23EEE|nr:hypothetical protein [Weissella confusa]MBJ7620984.1 hypothetical protein [Weissella confusa]MBJ7668297.1 hypothetical protein [Weissella confusa]MCT0005082.1 hypothetical protein [Weissella confusa]MCT0018771.1 hypothetical protein [Weissella confusa]MCT0039344.1 hypothetical protein [Weissella confusa]